MVNLEMESVENLYPFVLTEEQEHLRREIRDFAAREIYGARSCASKWICVAHSV